MCFEIIYLILENYKIIVEDFCIVLFLEVIDILIYIYII